MERQKEDGRVRKAGRRKTLMEERKKGRSGRK